jgi:catecholate siderophore receptor
MSSIFHRLCRLLLVVLGAGTLLCQAQVSPSAKLQGKVFDQRRAAVVGARITLVGTGQAKALTGASDVNGEFSFNVSPGEYRLRVSSQGFAETSKQVTFKQGDSNVVEIVLEVAESSATVTVTDTAGYQPHAVTSATRTFTPLMEIPQSISVVPSTQIRDQAMQSIADVVGYVPGIMSHQGENNRDQVVIRGNSTSADFFLNGVRDDVQYYRDLYNVESVEVLKGPNAMIFGRGGGGGVINRVTKIAGFARAHEITLQGGSFGNKRLALDLNEPINNKVAFRLNALYENSGSFRQHAHLDRYGINPTVSLNLGNQTSVTFAYERFSDRRVADRGIPSFAGRPADIPISSFFGNPDESKVRLGVNLLSVAVEHQAGNLNIRNRTLFGDYNRFYQNFVPGAVTADKTQVALSTYNNATTRRNLFNQTDFTYLFSLGRTEHTILSGVELGRQRTNNFRNTGFFNNTTTSILVPFENPTVSTPVTFRQSASDANNQIKTSLGAAYIQDQIKLSRKIQVVAGVRFDYFDLKFHNNRTGDDLRRIDHLLSPRIGIVFKPIVPLSIYGNYSVSYLPSSGDQFSSLTAITQQVKPEKFANYEMGAKWEIRRSLSFTAALYRLNRTNTRAIDPNDPTRIVQTGSQRTNGFEIGLNGSLSRNWKVSSGYAYQDAFIARATASARTGAKVAQVPHHTFSLWNHYQILPKLSAGLGIINRSNMFAAIDNTVVLPGYTRIDGAIYYNLSEKWRLQANLENVLDRKYYINADGNNNISPGRPRGVRVGMIFNF